MCALAAQELQELDVKRYTPFNFSGADVSLKAAEPHLTAGAPVVEALLGAVQRVLNELSTQLQQKTPQLKGLTAEALVLKGKEYQNLTALFRGYHGYVTNAQAYYRSKARC